MIYGDVQNNFSTILNRRDLTPSQTALFMQFAIQRIQRVLRIPAMENIVAISSDGSPNIPVPGDLLELISLATNDSVNQQTLVRKNLQTVIRAANIPGIPSIFCRANGVYMIGNCPVAGTTIYCSYYQDASGLAASTDFNWMTDACPDLLIYGALVRAGDFFLDDRKDEWEATFTQIITDLTLMAQQDDLVGASVNPAFDTGNDDGYCYPWT